MLERGRPPGGGAAHAAAAAAAAAALPLLTAEPKPFLRRGAGWAARMEAAREGRRYVPRGGPVKDYSQEGEAPLPRRTRPRGAVAPSRIPRSPAKQPRAAKPAPAGAGYDARRAAAAAAAPQQHHPQGRPQRSHPASPRPPPNNAAAATPRRAAQAGAPPVASASSGDHWARKLLGQVPTAPTPAQRPSWEAQQEHEELGSMEEFKALESQVLREVGNSPRAWGGGRKKAGGSGSSGPSPFSSARVSGGAAGSGWPAPPPAAQQLQEEAYVEEEDVSQSEGEGGVRCLSGSRDAHGQQEFAQAAAAGVASPLARRAVNFDTAAPTAARPAPAPPRQQPIYHDDDWEEEGEMQAQSAFVPGDAVRLQPSGLVQAFFRPAPTPAAAAGQATPHCHPQARLPAQPAAAQHTAAASEADAVEQLQQEVVRLQEERARVARLRMELDEVAARLEQEKEAFEKRKLEEMAKFEAERGEELRKLQRDRRVLEKQSRAILKMPTKQSKEEVAAVEALLAEERKIGRARDARHKLATERLRQQVLELQGRNAEMKEHIRYLEQQRLEQQPWAGGSGGAQEAGTAGLQSASPPVTARATPSKQRQPGGLPVVRVEQGGGSSSSRRTLGSAAPAKQPGGLPPARLAAGGWAYAAAAAAAEEDEEVEPQIADVQLEEDEVVTMCEEPSAEDAFDYCSGGAAVLATAADQRWHAGGATAGPAPRQQAAQQPAAAAAPGAMEQASSALARFQQLRASLVQHEGLQGRLASRVACLEPSSQVDSTLGMPAGGGSVAAHVPAGGAALHAGFAAPDPGSACSAPMQSVLGRGGDDDLRRLGRTLLAASSSGHGSPTDLHLPPAPAEQQAAGPAPVPGSAADSVVSESQQPDGRWERLWASGLREQRFANGSTKQSLPGGAMLTRFANGDVKKALPGGGVEYYYSEVDSWQVTHPSGVDVFFFPSGQVEAHHPGGIREILFPDGAVRKVLPDGRELAISAAHLSQEIQQAPPVASLLPASAAGGA